MKIAHVTPFYPPAIGGVEAFVYHLAKEQARQGHDVSVITNSLPSAGRRSFVFTHTSQELGSVKVYRLSSFIFRMTPVPLSLVSYLSEMDFDIIHLHLSGWIFQPEGTSLMAKVKQIPLISHVHMDPASQRSWVAPYRSLSFQLSLALSKAIIVPTDNYRLLMRNKYGQDEKVAVIPNGIEASLFESRAERGPEEEPRLLYVGRLVRQKGLDRLLLAMKTVLEQVPNVKLTVVGQPNTIEMEYYRQLMRTVNQLNLDDCVTFLGDLSNDRLQEIRSRAMLFVAPSRYESFGIALLEAMASGLSVVASDIPEFKEIAGGSALLVDPSPENLSNAIVRAILDKNLREKMIESSRTRARDFLWSNIAQQVLSLYALHTK